METRYETKAKGEVSCIDRADMTEEGIVHDFILIYYYLLLYLLLLFCSMSALTFAENIL